MNFPEISDDFSLHLQEKTLKFSDNSFDGSLINKKVCRNTETSQTRYFP